ncbi:MAG: RIP metalloprotease RseP, partial [Flavobacteriaceae bacterium]|nr:RIP metalloprotease RseP [Flavobacteriaceae bacterium]
MEFVIKISQFLLSLSLLIVLHELGHFIPAKLFKTKVEKFFLFFDIKTALFKKKIGETVYGIGWLPLGGYVKIAGMIDESMDKEQMAKPPEPWEFRSKPAWQRLIIMLGGVTVNFILAAVIYILMLFGYGDMDISTDSVQDGYWIVNPLLNDLGLETGDNIVSINGKEIVNYKDIKRNILDAQVITIERQGEIKDINLPKDFLGQLSSGRSRGLIELRYPFIVEEVADSSANIGVDLKQGDVIRSINGEELKYFDQVEGRLSPLKGQSISAEILRGDETITRELAVSDEGKVGIFPGGNWADLERLEYYDITKREYSFGESIGAGITRFGEQMSSYWLQLKLIFNPETGAYKGVGGFKAIYDIFPGRWSWPDFWNLTAFLSIMLGVLNLLPIPALDGGHVMFLLYEMVS